MRTYLSLVEDRSAGNVLTLEGLAFEIFEKLDFSIEKGVWVPQVMIKLR